MCERPETMSVEISRSQSIGVELTFCVSSGSLRTTCSIHGCGVTPKHAPARSKLQSLLRSPAPETQMMYTDNMEHSTPGHLPPPEAVCLHLPLDIANHNPIGPFTHTLRCDGKTLLVFLLAQRSNAQRMCERPLTGEGEVSRGGGN